MHMEYERLNRKDQMIFICRKIWEKGWVAANDGNLSIREEDGTFWTTPTGISKGLLETEDLVHLDGEGSLLEAAPGRRPSSEFPMHLRCYRERPEIRAVLHAHPPTATSYAVVQIPLDRFLTPEVIISLGTVPIAPYGTPSTQEIPESVAPLLERHDAVLLENHGALTVGEDALSAFYKMETLELFAQVSLISGLLGGGKELPPQRVRECVALRKTFGIRGRHPGDSYKETE